MHTVATEIVHAGMCQSMNMHMQACPCTGAACMHSCSLTVLQATCQLLSPEIYSLLKNLLTWDWQDRDAVLQRAAQAGVGAAVITGSSLSTSKSAQELAQAAAPLALYFTAGVSLHRSCPAAMADAPLL